MKIYSKKIPWYIYDCKTQVQEPLAVFFDIDMAKRWIKSEYGDKVPDSILLTQSAYHWKVKI
jgi:hypothetical protein